MRAAPLVLLLLAQIAPARAAGPAVLFAGDLKTHEDSARALREHYTKYEHRIPMRDGVHLFTAVYVPKDRSRAVPILLSRTPYGVAPYGVDNYPTERDGRALTNLAPARQLIRHGLIFALQDVRGRMMSEGEFVDVRPVNPRRGPRDTDETTDAYDTIEWLVRNVPGNNGRVGAWGHSYPGFYAAQAAISAHPALRAVSPQAPVTDWFLGDDFHHNGALCLADTVFFFANFGRRRAAPTPTWPWDFDPERGDLYDFFLRLGPLSNINARYLKGEIQFWNDVLRHPTRDAFWEARDPRPHLRGLKAAVLTVGGWFDAEDLWGTLATYRAVEAQSPRAASALVMGPWRHGGWLRTDGESLGEISFDARTSDYYREHVITPFFLAHLKGERAGSLAEAITFETGTNEWRRHDAWPPRGGRAATLWLREGGLLSTAPPDRDGADAYPSDPARPVPHSGRHLHENDGSFMVEDQRFASRRPDVLVYQTPPLAADVTLAGPIEADLWVSTTGADADFVVKIIDVFPESARDPVPNPRGVRMAGYQMLVRGEIMRGRFREGFARPRPFTPGTPARVRFALPDINHTFRAGHRLMVQVQSSWFPLFDRNPQTSADPYTATAADFRAATHTVHRERGRGSGIQVRVLRGSLPGQP